MKKITSIVFKIQIGDENCSTFPEAYSTSDAAINQVRSTRRTTGPTAEYWQTVRLAVVKVTTVTEEVFLDTPPQPVKGTPPPSHFFTPTQNA